MNCRLSVCSAVTFGLALWVTAACSLLLPSAASGQASLLKLQSAKGRVEIQRQGRGAWAPVKRSGQALAIGDHVRTGPNSSAHIILSGGRRVALGPSTEAALREPGRQAGWRLLLGRIRVFLTGKQELEVGTAAATAAAPGTTFDLYVSEDGTTELTVVDGVVRFYNDLGSVLVEQAQRSSARPGQAPTRPAAVDPASLMAWEASLQTLIVEAELPSAITDPARLETELQTRQAAVQRQPDSPTARSALAAALLDARRPEEAVAEAQQSVDLGQGLPSAQVASLRGELGFALLAAGRPSEAQEQLQLAREADGGNRRWALGLALIALGQRDRRPAVEALQRLVQGAPDDPLPRAYLAAALLRAGMLPEAVVQADAAVRLAPESHIANAYQAFVRLAEGRADAAEAAGRVAVEHAPGSALAHEALGTAAFFAGDDATARAELARSVELNPLSASSHLTLAKLEAHDQELGAALEAAQTAVSLNPMSAPARSTLGLLYLLDHDPARAAKQFKAALALDPSLAEARLGWGSVLAAQGEFREALEQQKAAVSLDTDSASAHNNLGGAYAAQGRMDLAIPELESAITLQPTWGMPYANMALVHLELNQFDEALRAAERAVALGERSAFVHTVLARIVMRQGRTDRALTELRQAVALDDRYPQAHFQLARLYLDQGRSRDAVREVMTSVATDPAAMLEARLYARTENTASFGSFGQWHDDLRHGDATDQGRLSYYVSGQAERTDGARPVNADRSERFAELIAGYQAHPSQQFVFFGSLFDRSGGLPGPVTQTSLGDPDDRQRFRGREGLFAYRQRLSRQLTAMAKWSARSSWFGFANPDSLSASDSRPFGSLVLDELAHSPEVRVDLELGKRDLLSFGYAHSVSHLDNHGAVGTLDPVTGESHFTGFAEKTTAGTGTAWAEWRTRPSDRLDLRAGAYWGRQTGATHVLLPKIVAVYRPEPVTWWSFVAAPVFRADALELAPVEALADPHGIGSLDTVEGGAGRSYEVRYQRQTTRNGTLTASLAHQRVRGLLLSVQDAALTGLPARALMDSGARWIAEAAYEQSVTDQISGRAWLRWQSTTGRSAQAQALDTEWPYTPRWQAGARLDYINREGLRVGLDGTYVGRRFHDPLNAQVVPGHFLLGLRVESQRSLHESYFLEVGNLLNRGSADYASFPSPGRSATAGMTYRF
jgi:tetratricopeptide (TPR) repeat protein